MSFDYQSPEALARRKVFLSGQEELFDLVTNKHGGVIAGDLGERVYNLYLHEGLSTPEVAERVDQMVQANEVLVVITPEQKVEEALNLAASLAGYDGAHHKDHCIDQMVRALTGPGYRKWVHDYEYGENPPKDEDGEPELQYEWHTGIPS